MGISQATILVGASTGRPFVALNSVGFSGFGQGMFVS